MDQVAAWVLNYQTEPDKAKAIRAIVASIFYSIGNLLPNPENAHAVKVQKNAALCSLLNHLDKEWREFSQRTDRAVKPEGFAWLVKKKCPEAYENWMRLRVTIGLPRI